MTDWRSAASIRSPIRRASRLRSISTPARATTASRSIWGGAEINGSFFVEVDGGFGVDAMSVRAIVPCILPESDVRIALLGGPGMDAIDTSLTGLENEGGRFVLEAIGGEGADRLNLTAMDPCVVPGSRTRFALAGGADNDAISALVGARRRRGRGPSSTARFSSTSTAAAATTVWHST